MNVVSLFAGCGGLDLGFERAGVNVIWANEYDTAIEATYRFNHPATVFSNADIRKLSASEIPDADGIIGGPPCQAWSEGGKSLGLEDERGKLFLDYIRIVKEKHPKFFVIENVPGILSPQHINTFNSFISQLESPGYKIKYKLLDSADFGVPQNRKRVIIVGIRNDITTSFEFPSPSISKHVTLRQSIGDLAQFEPRKVNSSISATADTSVCPYANHETFDAPYDVKFMSRNRVRSWDEPSFTIQAQAKNEPLHPSAPKMLFVSSNKRAFAPNAVYRRLSVRECARIQSFPDDFKFIYNDIRDGYKMVGNAVPPLFAQAIACQIVDAFEASPKNNRNDITVLAVTVFPNKNNNTFIEFSQNSRDVEYYFGRSHSSRSDFADTINNMKYFAPIINGKITTIYNITSVCIKSRLELPHDISNSISPHDKRLVLSLSLFKQLIQPLYINNLSRGWSYRVLNI